jgi:hypothetical protein
MKNVLYFLFAALLIAATCGCNTSSCGNRQSWFSWWNRGDSCRTCGTADTCADGVGVGTPIMNNAPFAPSRSGNYELPAPANISPVN